MTTQDEPNAWSHEDEIDLRRYVETLFKWWREILFLAILLPLLSALGLLLWGILGSATYEATSSVIIARSTRNAVVNEQFETVLIDEYSAELTYALVGLVYSGSIAEKVIAELEDELSDDESGPGELLQKIEATSWNALPNMRGDSDLIVIAAEADSPKKAAAIANSWAKHYITHVYAIYGQVPNEVIDSMQVELAQTEAVYEQAQTEVNEFLAISPMLMLERQITGTLTIADSLIAAQTRAIVEQFADGSANQSSAVDLVQSDAEQQEALIIVGERIRALQSQLESERATHHVLSEKRDIAWEAWRTLKVSIDEMSAAQLSTSGQVRLASAAVVPSEPRSGVNIFVALPLAMLIGLLLGVFMAFFGEYMGRAPFFSR